ncbi:MAG: cyclic nucleotide-binding domain-containing protein [candidate division FCPU426 bacterium]
MSTVVDRLRQITLFKQLKDDPGALAKVAALIRTQAFPPGHCIIREGERGDAMYILNRGSVRVEKKTLAKDPFVVANLTDDMNAFFGEVALMDDDLRSASVCALTRVECFVLRKRDFERLCADNPKIGFYVVREIARSLAGRLRKTTADNATLIAALIHVDEG